MNTVIHNTNETETVNRLKVNRNTVRSHLVGSKQHYKIDKKRGTRKYENRRLSNSKRVHYIKEKLEMRKTEQRAQENEAWEEAEEVRKTQEIAKFFGVRKSRKVKAALAELTYN